MRRTLKVWGAGPVEEGPGPSSMVSWPSGGSSERVVATTSRNLSGSRGVLRVLLSAKGLGSFTISEIASASGTS